MIHDLHRKHTRIVLNGRAALGDKRPDTLIQAIVLLDHLDRTLVAFDSKRFAFTSLKAHVPLVDLFFHTSNQQPWCRTLLLLLLLLLILPLQYRATFVHTVQ